MNTVKKRYLLFFLQLNGNIKTNYEAMIQQKKLQANEKLKAITRRSKTEFVGI